MQFGASATGQVGGPFPPNDIPVFFPGHGAESGWVQAKIFWKTGPKEVFPISCFHAGIFSGGERDGRTLAELQSHPREGWGRGGGKIMEKKRLKEKGGKTTRTQQTSTRPGPLQR